MSTENGYTGVTFLIKKELKVRFIITHTNILLSTPLSTKWLLRIPFNGIRFFTLVEFLRFGCLARGCSCLRDSTSARCLLRLQIAARLTWYSFANADCFSPCAIRNKMCRRSISRKYREAFDCPWLRIPKVDVLSPILQSRSWPIGSTSQWLTPFRGFFIGVANCGHWKRYLRTGVRCRTKLLEKSRADVIDSRCCVAWWCRSSVAILGSLWTRPWLGKVLCGERWNGCRYTWYCSWTRGCWCTTENELSRGAMVALEMPKAKMIDCCNTLRKFKMQLFFFVFFKPFYTRNTRKWKSR